MADGVREPAEDGVALHLGGYYHEIKYFVDRVLSGEPFEITNAESSRREGRGDECHHHHHGDCAHRDTQADPQPSPALEAALAAISRCSSPPRVMSYSGPPLRPPKSKS